MSYRLTPEQKLDILTTFKDIFLIQWMEGDLNEIDVDVLDW
jgi:hypothetical protein